jgi:hypothetical protein
MQLALHALPYSATVGNEPARITHPGLLHVCIFVGALTNRKDGCIMEGLQVLSGFRRIKELQHFVDVAKYAKYIFQSARSGNLDRGCNKLCHRIF